MKYIDLVADYRHRNPLMERGQEVIEGVKSQEKVKKIRRNKQSGKWEVDVTERYNMLYNSEESALKALTNIEEAKLTIHAPEASMKECIDLTGELEVISSVKHMPGHKDSHGNSAPWVIVDHQDGRILSSHPSKETAEEHLKQMQMFKHMKAEDTSKIEKDSFTLVDDPAFPESDENFKAVGHCNNCGTHIYIIGDTVHEQDKTLEDRKNLADKYCPGCGIQMSEEGAFQFSKKELDDSYNEGSAEC